MEREKNMIQALHFKDEKSDKFWFIETLDCEKLE